MNREDLSTILNSHKKCGRVFIKLNDKLFRLKDDVEVVPNNFGGPILVLSANDAVEEVLPESPDGVVSQYKIK